MSWKSSRSLTVILSDSKKVDYNVILGVGSGFPKKKMIVITQISFVLCTVYRKKKKKTFASTE